MLIEETFSVDAPKSEVIRLLLDIPRMASCVPGVEDLRRVDDDRYEATVLVRMGPIQARFKGDVTVDATGAPDTLVATASGRDATTGSVAQVSFVADLVENGDSTEIRSVSNVTIRGRLGQFGSGVVTATAREMVKSFAQCVGQELAGTAPGAAPDTLRPSKPVGFGSILFRGVTVWLREVWHRIVRRSGRERGGGE
jgi:carbon monoxide dehydrogenase subunit G